MGQELAAAIALSVPELARQSVRLDQYLGEWAIDETRLASHLSLLRSLDWQRHLADPRSATLVVAAQNAGYADLTTADGVCVLPISGTLTKAGNSLDGGGCLVNMRRQIRAAADDPKISAICLVVDSPGGSVAGTADVASAIAYAKTKKPCMALVEDCCCSAAYWIASQCEKIYANADSAAIGSIGVYAVVRDTSELAASNGVKVHVVKAGEHKGAGVPGAPITDAQLAEMQQHIDAIHAVFVDAVSAGRGLPRDAAASLADGRVHLSAKAQQIGLIDGIKSLDAVVAELVAAAKSRSPSPATQSLPQRKPTMSDSLTPAPATLAQIREACPGASADWILAQLESQATVAGAMQAYIKHQGEQLTAKQAALEENRDASKSRTNLGVDPLRNRKPASAQRSHTDAGSSGDPVGEFNSLVAEIGGRAPTLERRMAAIRTVASQNPDLYREYLFATNKRTGAHRRLIGEKLETAGYGTDE